MQTLSEFGHHALRGSRSLTVLSYNILAEAFSADCDLYASVPTEWMRFEHRVDNILRKVRLSQADLVCLQEVDMGHFESIWRPAMAQEGFAGELQDDKKRAPNHTVAVATFWRKGKLRKRASESRSRALLSTFVVGGDDEGQREIPIFVANCHLQGAPHLPHLRLQQMKSVIKRYGVVKRQNKVGANSNGNNVSSNKNRKKKEKEKNNKNNEENKNDDDKSNNLEQNNDSKKNESGNKNDDKGKEKDDVAPSGGNGNDESVPIGALPASGMPIIACGDFNSVPSGAVYRYAVEGMLEAGFKEENVVACETASTHPHEIGSAYADVTGGEPSLTFARPPLRSAGIDFIFYSTDWLTPVAALDPMSGEDRDAVCGEAGLPSETNGSDHLPIAATFAWKDQV